jgi:hypothetical protein
MRRVTSRRKWLSLVMLFALLAAFAGAAVAKKSDGEDKFHRKGKSDREDKSDRKGKSDRKDKSDRDDRFDHDRKRESKPQRNVKMPKPTVPVRVVVPSRQVDARVLVVSADGTEPVLAAIQQTLGYLGTPYDLWIATARPGQLTADRLAAGTRGFYQAVILATGNLAYTPDGGTTFLSALSTTEWTALWSYEAQFGVRQVTWYTFPTPDYGFTEGAIGVDTSAAPLPLRLTTEGRGVFSYLNPATSLAIADAWTYLAFAADTATTPLVTDSAGRPLVAIRRYADGRENLALTFDGNHFLRHSLAFAYGVVNWATGGLFLGERHVYASAQIDDIFIASDLFPSGEYRITGTDLSRLADWQSRRRAQPTTASLRLHFALNGEGVVEAPRNDSLVATARSLRDQFKWINHTYTHDVMDGMDYATALFQIQRNNTVARDLRLDQTGLNAYSRLNLVTPEISGLSNPAAMRAAFDAGVRYVVSDTSRPGQSNPSPNAGIYNAQHPGILQIPRYPTNLFYNVSTPSEWVTEYNFLYGVGGVFPPPAGWGRNLTYAEIVDFESEILLRDLLRGDANPWMFHQANVRLYDSTRSIFSDLLDRVIDKYNAIFALPMLSPTMDELGGRFAQRTQYAQARVSATIVPGMSITITSDRDVVVPVTGLRTTGAELYGGQFISWVTVRAGRPVTLPLQVTAGQLGTRSGR